MRLLLWLVVLTYSLLFTQLALAQHTGMRTHKADLGQIDQAVWNSSRGRFLEMTDNGFVATRLTDHVEPILVLISPIFWLWDHVAALLLLQVVVVALGAWPLYELALAQRLPPWLALALALAYLLTPQLQSAVLTEFHAAPLAAPLVLWAAWAVERQRWPSFVMATVLVAAVKEETALLAAGLGLWALYRHWLTRPRLFPSAPPHPVSPSRLHFFPLSPCLLIPLSLLWFVLATFVIVPLHAEPVYGVAESGYFARYGALGDSPADIFRSFFTQPALVWQIASEPARLHYLLNLLRPFAWLSLLAPEALLFALPVLLANLLSAYPAQYYGEFHYSAPLVPYVAISAVYGIGRLWRRLLRWSDRSSPAFQHLPTASLGLMTLATLLTNRRTSLPPLLAAGLVVWVMSWAGVAYGVAGRGPWGGRYDPTPINEHHRLLPRFVAQLPAEAALTATAAVHPHVSHRRYIYQFPLGLAGPVPADWALLDVTTNTDMAPGDLKAKVDEMLASEWGVVDGADGFLLLRKGMVNKAPPGEFYTFAQSPASHPPVEAISPATSPIPRSVTVSDWPRWRESKISTEWVAPPRFAPASRILWFGVALPSGELVYHSSAAMPTAWLWRPPDRWQAGESSRAVTLALHLPRTWGVVASWPLQTPPPASWVMFADNRAGLAALYRRNDQGALQPLPMTLFSTADFGAAWTAETGEKLLSATGLFVTSTGDPMTVTAWLPARPGAPGDQLDLWLQWRGTAWPGNLTTFVHLRQAGANRAQADGTPRYIVAYAADQLLPRQGFVNDWRQLTIPADAPVGETWQVVIGLYDAQNGQRAELLDASGQLIGNELVIGQVTIAAPPLPDQTCALIPATCAAQPRGKGGQG